MNNDLPQLDLLNTITDPVSSSPPDAPLSWSQIGTRFLIYERFLIEYNQFGPESWIPKFVLTDIGGDTTRNRISEIRAWLEPQGWTIKNDYDPKTRYSRYRLQLLESRGSNESQTKNSGNQPPGTGP